MKADNNTYNEKNKKTPTTMDNYEVVCFVEEVGEDEKVCQKFPQYSESFCQSKRCTRKKNGACVRLSALNGEESSPKQ